MGVADALNDEPARLCYDGKRCWEGMMKMQPTVDVYKIFYNVAHGFDKK